jgi:hypothetical protein
MSSTMTITQTTTTLKPFPLLTSPLKSTYDSASVGIQMGHDMVHIHNIILRGLNAIILQAPHIPPNTTAASDLLQLCRFWCDMIVHHHDTEEEYFFPAVEKLIGVPGSMAGNVAGHEAFESALLDFEKWAETTTSATYSSEELLQRISILGPPMVQHLSDEIPSMINLEGKARAKDLKKVWDGAGEYSKKNSKVGPQIVIPMFMGCHDVTFPTGDQGSVEFPLPVVYGINYLFWRQNANVWRLLPSDCWGKPQKLPYLPESEGGMGLKA